jgi:hypothetical protein
MKKIDKDELYGHVRSFLKDKGVELQDGSYSRRIQQGCHVLARTINTSRDVLERAKAEADRRLDKMRQVIHEKTAPKPPPSTPPPSPPVEPAKPKAKPPAVRATTTPEAKATPAKRKPRASRTTKKGR